MFNVESLVGQQAALHAVFDAHTEPDVRQVCRGFSPLASECAREWPAATVKRERIESTHCSSSGEISDRQTDSKFCAARLRLEFDSAVVMPHKASHDVEAETNSLPLWFSSKERIEDAVADLMGNTGPIIDDSH